MYYVKEIFYSLQGEGAQTGRPSIFCRFTGCNLWSGREADRNKSVCFFCDTDFIGTNGQNGGKFKNATQLCTVLANMWPTNQQTKPYIIFTGGEPALQLDQQLVDACHFSGFEVAIETNGTRSLPDNIDWICVSPKSNSEIKIKQGDELKLIYPQPLALPEEFKHLNFKHFFIQPMDDNKQNNYTKAAIDYCLQNPKWKLSLQTHKILDID